MDHLRRKYLLAALGMLALGIQPHVAFAKDGDSSDGGNSGSGGSGNSGSGNSGGDDDSSDGDDSGNDGDDDVQDDDDSSSGSNKDDDHERAFRAVKNGKVVSVRQLRAHLNENYPGRILKVELKRQGGHYVYKVKVLGAGNKVKALTLDGLTLQNRTF